MEKIDGMVIKNLTTKDIRMIPLKHKFDKITLNMYMAFIYKDSVLRTRKVLMNIYKLFSSLDDSIYENDLTLTNRLWIIKTSLYGKLFDGFDNDESIKIYCKDNPECDDYRAGIIDEIEKLKISHEESKYLIKKTEDILQFGYTISIKNIMKEILNHIDDDNFKSYKVVSDDLYHIANAVINIKRSTASLGSDQTFSLDPEIFEAVVEDAVLRLQDRNRILMTGLKLLNTILSPGYLSKRLYTYLAFPGKGKSTVLLKSALDIRKYNKGIKTKDPDKRPAVLFLTLENDIPETIERMYNMSVDGDDIRNFKPSQVKKQLRDKGEFKLTDENNIDIIIKEYKNRELDTNDLYTIIQDLNDEGIEVVSLIVDYLKRLRPSEKGANEKEELKNITNELKELAKFFDIPVNKTSGLIYRFIYKLRKPI